MLAPYPCPECGGKLDVDEHAETEQTMWRKGTPGFMPYVEVVLRPAVVAGCTACEFALEVRR